MVFAWMKTLNHGNYIDLSEYEKNDFRISKL